MAHVIVIGAGAIGSHLLPHLARSSRVSRITETTLIVVACVHFFWPTLLNS